jgi:hypothetical protein
VVFSWIRPNSLISFYRRFATERSDFLERQHVLDGAPEIDVSDWAQCQLVLGEIRGALEGHDLRYRGIGNSESELTTTLERAESGGMSIHEYFMVTTQRILPAVESLTSVVWDVPEFDDKVVIPSFSRADLFAVPSFPPMKLYRYWVYLRHHGFPSLFLVGRTQPTLRLSSLADVPS